MQYHISEIDEKRFGFKIAKAYVDNNSDIEDLIEKTKKDAIELLILRTLTTELKAVHRVEAYGFSLMDTLIYYIKKQIKEHNVILTDNYSYSLALPIDAKLLEEASREIFKNYIGHYHSDKKLNSNNADLVYSSWAYNSCINKNVADAVILIKKEEEIAAFATIKKTTPYEIDGVLFGVSPKHRYKNLHVALMKLSENWGIKYDYKQMITSTQITNTSVQKNWCRLSFEPLNSYYTYHKWFN